MVMANNSAQIAQIRALLATGATQIIVDGQQVTVSPASLRKQLRQLMATDDTNAGRRPLMATVNLGGYWRPDFCEGFPTP
jgi:predicted esterase YcpF (UPF0227 family)